jgi:serine phosphatase RsbU (regulator of sigma subunit)
VGTPGTALGLLPRTHLTRSRHHLNAGDCLIAYTDGLVEQRRTSRDGRTEQFGHARLLSTLARAADLPAEKVVNHIRDTLDGFGDEPQGDDIALLVIRAINQAASPQPATTRDDGAPAGGHCASRTPAIRSA